MARRLLMEEGMALPKTKTTKKRPTQADCLQRLGGVVSSYYVGESAYQPGLIQVCQYATLLVGPISPTSARELAANLNAMAEAIEVAKLPEEGEGALSNAVIDATRAHAQSEQGCHLASQALVRAQAALQAAADAVDKAADRHRQTKRALLVAEGVVEASKSTVEKVEVKS